MSHTKPWLIHWGATVCALVLTQLSPLCGATHTEGSSKLWLIAVGANRYAQAEAHGDGHPATKVPQVNLPDLRFAVNDVEELAKAFIDNGVPQEQVIVLHDNQKDRQLQPTKANVLRVLEAFSHNSQVGANDVVMFVFSGHGINVSTDSYLCFQDADLQTNASGDTPPAGTLRVQELLDWLGDLDVLAKVVVTDACRGCVLGEKTVYGRYDLSTQWRKMIASRREKQVNHDSKEFADGRNNLYVVSSCLPGQESFEDEASQHGLFLGKVIEGVKGPAGYVGGNYDRYLTVGEIVGYACRETELAIDSQKPVCEGVFTRDVPMITMPKHIHEAMLERHAPDTFSVSRLTPDQAVARDVLNPRAFHLLPYDQVTAIEDATEAITRDPDYAGHRRLRIAAYVLTKQFVEAIDDAKHLKDTIKVKTATAEIPLTDAGSTNPRLTLPAGVILELSEYCPESTAHRKGSYLWAVAYQDQSRGPSHPLKGWVKAESISVDISGTYRTHAEQVQQSVPESQLQRLQTVDYSHRSISGLQVGDGRALSNAAAAYRDFNTIRDDINGLGFGTVIPSTPARPWIEMGIGILGL